MFTNIYMIPTPEKPLKVTFEDSVSIEKSDKEFEYIITRKIMPTDEELELLKEIIDKVNQI